MRPLLVFIILAGIGIITLIGCDSCGSDTDSKSTSHQDTASFFLMSDSIKFSLYSTTFGVVPPTGIHIYRDSTLTDSMRIELELESNWEGSIRRSEFWSFEWQHDTLGLTIGYTNQIIPGKATKVNLNKKNDQVPQCQPIGQGTNVNSANVFIPPGTEAIYIGF